jgi:hypothetical protein
MLSSRRAATACSTSTSTSTPSEATRYTVLLLTTSTKLMYRFVFSQPLSVNQSLPRLGMLSTHPDLDVFAKSGRRLLVGGVRLKGQMMEYG